LSWQAAPNGQAVLDAMQWLKEQSGHSLRVTNDAPKGFLSKAWKPLVLDANGRVKGQRAYIFALIDEWLKALKRRDIFVVPGIRYGDPRVGLLKGTDWQNNKAAVCRALNHSLEGKRELKPLVQLLDTTFSQVAERADKNTDLKFETTDGKKRFIITPLDRLAEPSSLIELRRAVHGLMPKAGIPDVLLEVMRMTGFNSAFTHLSGRPSRVEGFESTLCAVLVGAACNIGFSPLIRSEVAPLRASRLSWCDHNFVRQETIQAANATIVNAHSKLEITKHWGNGHVASADGLRFIAPKSAIHAGPNPKYFGRGRGITWYNMLSDQYSGLGATVIPGTLRDSLALLALLLDQDTELEPIQIMTDTAAYSDAIFGLFWLLGYNFSPRLADVGGARLWRIDKTTDYGCLNDLIDGTINIQLIEDNWEDLLRLAGSLKLGHLKAEGIMRILQVRDRPTTLAKALVQLGRIFKTLHILNYADDPKMRRQILLQLNRQEFRHKLARKIYHGDRGEVRNALKQGQEEQLGILGLALNAIIYWNAVYMQEAIKQLKADGHNVEDVDIARLSPILWRHINFLGRYDFALPDSVRDGGLRPLRDNSFEHDF
jgi:TnpA family transposase